ncbi:YcnI family protein [Microlunatus speluncae]|uniref:YcnI family copper-binding membrane protein n=1 Tax=Microlunatus speluncae TaxID=2594267 RepID=UPI0013762316|nr:YcnI family protein [Microlunatus speluncae]
MGRRVLPVVGAALGGLLIAAWSAIPAAAHVSVKADQAVAGGYAVLTFAVPHGCEGSPTTKIAIKIPESVTSTKPTVVADWQVEAPQVKLAQPQTDSHGNQITERVDQVIYTAETPLPDALRQTFEVQVKLPEDAAGTTLAFPVVQSCVQGETAWIQVAAAGENGEELEHPAPAIKIVAAEPDEVTAGSGTPGEPTQAAAAPVGWTGPAGLAAGVLGLVLGGIALARTRQRP